jgi:hypothetical protein
MPKIKESLRSISFNKIGRIPQFSKDKGCPANYQAIAKLKMAFGARP